MAFSDIFCWFLDIFGMETLWFCIILLQCVGGQEETISFLPLDEIATTTQSMEGTVNFNSG